MKEAIMFITGVIFLFLVLFFLQEGNLTASMVDDDNLCGNGVIDENETCLSCSRDVMGEEGCDDIDNDCDKMVDEGNVCRDILNCGEFERACPEDEPCNFGVCGPTVLLLHFDEGRGTLAWDSSGNKNHGTLMKLAKWTDDRSKCLFDGCLNLKQRYDSVDLDLKAVSALIKDQFTISFWARSRILSDRPTFGFSESGISNRNNPLASYDKGITISNGISGPGGYQLLQYYFPNAPQYRWRHYALVDDGTHYIAYVDGKQDRKVRITIDPYTNVNRKFLIGKSGFDGRWSDNFNGYMDEFIIYDRSLSADEIYALYFSGLK